MVNKQLTSNDELFTKALEMMNDSVLCKSKDFESIIRND